MRIAIIGAGHVGTALGRGWAKAGHDIRFASRSYSSPRLRDALAQVPGARATTNAEAAQDADVLVLAVPWASGAEVLRHAGSLAGRIVIDATNPIGPGLTLAVGHDSSGAEELAKSAAGAKVVKAFNTIGVEGMEDPRFPEGPATAWIAGDDAGAKETVSGLARDLGFDPVDCGPLRTARLLEPMALLWIQLAMKQGLGRGIALRLARR